MARVGFGSMEAVAGLYAFLRDQEMANYRRWQASGELLPYPRLRRLDDFEAGRPVNVAGGDIWGWNAVQGGAPATPRRAVGITDGRFIVSPDDSFIQDRGGGPDVAMALWLEENGL